MANKRLKKQRQQRKTQQAKRASMYAAQLRKQQTLSSQAPSVQDDHAVNDSVPAYFPSADSDKSWGWPEYLGLGGVLGIIGYTGWVIYEKVGHLVHL